MNASISFILHFVTELFRRHTRSKMSGLPPAYAAPSNGSSPLTTAPPTSSSSPAARACRQSSQDLAALEVLTDPVVADGDLGEGEAPAFLARLQNENAPCAKRLAAISQYSSSSSIPIALRPSSFAATSVVPLPMKGSSTMPPGGVTRRQR
jgi:hypothetical protein